MSFGKMNAKIDIVSQTPTTDNEGYTTMNDTVLKTVNAYKEDRHGNKVWQNRAAFSEATCLFRFRAIPGLTLTLEHIIMHDGIRYRIESVENVRSRNMYYEVMAIKVQSSKR
jgi:head-tail adaptor